MGWCFGRQRCGWLDGCVALGYRVEFQVGRGFGRDWDWLTWSRCCSRNVSCGTGSPGLSQTRVQRAIKWLCVCGARACVSECMCACMRVGAFFVHLDHNCVSLSPAGVLTKNPNRWSWFTVQMLPSTYPTICCEEI